MDHTQKPILRPEISESLAVAPVIGVMVGLADSERALKKFKLRQNRVNDQIICGAAPMPPYPLHFLPFSVTRTILQTVTRGGMQE
jgi:hypothetical protein